MQNIKLFHILTAICLIGCDPVSIMESSDSEVNSPIDSSYSDAYEIADSNNDTYVNDSGYLDSGYSDSGTDSDAESVDCGVEDSGITDASEESELDSSYDLNTVYVFISTGQSLSVGVRAEDFVMPIVTPGPIQNHYMWSNLFAPGENHANTSDQWILKEISNPMRGSAQSTGYPWNIGEESLEVAMSERFNELDSNFSTAHIVVGQNGMPMRVINKNGSGNSYSASLTEAKKFYDTFKTQGKKVIFAGIILTHGESDFNSNTYGDELVQLQSDYENDLKAINGQQEPVTLYMTQPSAAYPTYVGGVNNLNNVMLDVAKVNSKIVLIGAKYDEEYYTNDIHLTANGSRNLGRVYADKIYKHKAGTFKYPAYPTNIDNQGNKIIIDFNLPSGNLMVDSSVWNNNHSIVNTEWSNGLGFEVSDDIGKITITEATVYGNTAILLLSRSTHTHTHVGYVFNVDGDLLPRRGQIRTNDGDWLVQFDKVL